MRKNRNNRPPEVGARGLLRLRCPCCGKEFGTYLHVPQMSIGCRCGATISLERGLANYESKPPVRLNLWKFRVIVIFNQINVIFHPAISAPFVGFCSEKHPLHVLKPCKIRAETVHLLSDKQKSHYPPPT